MKAYKIWLADPLLHIQNCQIVDSLDYLFWSSCFTGPGVTSNELVCTPFDFDGDQDVDLYDATQFMNAIDQH